MKHFLKKLSCALLAMLMLLTVTACGESGGKPADEVPEELKPYVIPWEKDVIAEAKEKGTMEFYFMASLGMDVGAEGSTEDPQKWGDSPPAGGGADRGGPEAGLRVHHRRPAARCH